MALQWTTVHAVLWTIMYLCTKNVSASPCAEVNSSSTVVPLGSAVTASCYIKKDCPLTQTSNFFIEWNRNTQFIHRSNANQKNVYEVHITNLTDTQNVLVCRVCTDSCSIVAAVEIRAGYPPSAPQNLTCVLNLKEIPSILVCTWEPGEETPGIPTNYTLYTETRDLEKVSLNTFAVPLGKSFFRVPRCGFTHFIEMKVYVQAMNVLGQASSNLLVMDPMTTVKLDAPVIQGVGTQTFGCLEYKWSLSPTQNWIKKILNLEIKFKPVTSKMFSERKFSYRPDKRVKVCGLLHGMSYESQMRVRYQSSPWSEWSNSTVATTPMKAPTGRQVAWLKLQRPESRNPTAQLFWKPSLQFRPNSMNVSYTVSINGKFPRKKETVCVTDQQHCSFQIHAKVKKVYLITLNEAGKSSPTEVAVYRQSGMDQVSFFNVLPQSEDSLMATWKSKDNTANAYVLEWKALCGMNQNHVSFEIVGRNQTSFVASGLEPYVPYEISLYPKYEGGIGRPYSTVAYTKQKAPSTSPKLNTRKITPTFMELYWDEIPLEQRNGIITGYRIFYRDEKNKTGVKDTDSTVRHVVLKDLYPFTIYELFIMTSTHGGSVNGSTVKVQTASIDAFEIVLIVIPACVGLTLFFFGLFTCFIKQKWMKTYVWPVIPDPANSNIKKWATAGSLECMQPLKEIKDPVMLYLSHISLLNLPEKELLKGDENVKIDNWPYNGKNVNVGHNEPSPDSKSIDSEQQSEAVPYATVVFAEPYRRQPAPPPVYLRSESTQPLLEEEEPSSPRQYEKIANQVNLADVHRFSSFKKNLGVREENALWVDFPMLRSLEMNSKS